MNVVAKKNFSSLTHGNVSIGDTLKNLSVDMTRQLLEWDMIEEVEIDEIKKPQQSLSSQAAPVLPKNNVDLSEKTEENAQLLQSIPALEPQSPILYTDATEDGGSNTI